MDRNEFWEYLRQNQIDPEMVSFDNSIAEGDIIQKKGPYWVISYKERGIEFNLHAFLTESEALEYELNRLVEYYEIINNPDNYVKRTHGDGPNGI